MSGSQVTDGGQPLLFQRADRDAGCVRRQESAFSIARCGKPSGKRVVAFFSNRQPDDIIPVMRVVEQATCPNFLRTPGIAGPVALALVACLMLWPHAAEQRKLRVGAHSNSHAFRTIMPTTSVDFAATPEVTSPTATVARFSVSPLPVVASVVQVCRLREVTVARIGGLHGP